MTKYHKKIVIVCLLIIIIFYWFGFSNNFDSWGFCWSSSEPWEIYVCFLEEVIYNMRHDKIGFWLLAGGSVLLVSRIIDWYKKYRTKKGIEGITNWDLFGGMFLSGIISVWLYKLGLWTEMWELIYKILFTLPWLLIILVVVAFFNLIFMVLKEKYFDKK